VVVLERHRGQCASPAPAAARRTSAARPPHVRRTSAARRPEVDS
jgi:hypothetical protein